MELGEVALAFFAQYIQKDIRKFPKENKIHSTIYI